MGLFYSISIRQTLAIGWLWHTSLARLTFKPFKTWFETFEYFLPVVLHDPQMLRVFAAPHPPLSPPLPAVAQPPRLTTEGQLIFNQYRTCMETYDRSPSWLQRRTIEPAENEVTAWIRQRLIYFPRRVHAVDEFDLWWLVLCRTSHFAGLYTPPSTSFLATVRHNVGFRDEPPAPAKHVAERRRLV